MITTTVAAPLVTTDELAAYPGGPFDALSVEIAAATVRGACNWHIAPAVEVEYVIDQSHRSNVIMVDALRLGTVVEVIDNATEKTVVPMRVSPVEIKVILSSGIYVLTCVLKILVTSAN